MDASLRRQAERLCGLAAIVHQKPGLSVLLRLQSLLQIQRTLLDLLLS